MIKITIDDRTFEHPRGISCAEIIRSYFDTADNQEVVAVYIDNKPADLSTQIMTDTNVAPIYRNSPQGIAIIRHSCAHVLAESVQSLYPDTKVAIGPVIDNGFYYDFHRPSGHFTPEELLLIETKMREIIARDTVIIKEIWTRENAISVFSQLQESFKVQIINDLPQSESISIYRQGQWFDLCRGPHVASTGQIGVGFKLTKVSGAYWRGDQSQESLSRIYGTAWPTKNDLDIHLAAINEAEKRDHRRLGKELDLFHFQEEGPGVVFWHPKGWAMFQLLIAYMRRRLSKDYQEVNAPQVLEQSLWETSGHLGWYKENMFGVQALGDKAEDRRRFVLKPMNCPGHIQIFKHTLKSYRDLPTRLAEFGIVHRYEPSGAVHGLMRVRCFTQDDAHVFCTEEQMTEECLRIHALIVSVYRDFGFNEIVVKLSTRPNKRVGSEESWDHAENIMRDVLDRITTTSPEGISTALLPEEGAFYGPKFEYTLKDAIGREWQCGTIQVDFNLPERFGVSYVDTDGNRKLPIMIHRAICGSLERFLGIIIENYAGHFPLWLSPVQIVIATITSDSNEYAHKIYSMSQALGLRVELDDRNEKIGYKIREHSTTKIPVIFVIGRNEAASETVAIRRLGSKDAKTMNVDDALRELAAEASMPA